MRSKFSTHSKTWKLSSRTAIRHLRLAIAQWAGKTRKSLGKTVCGRLRRNPFWSIRDKFVLSRATVARCFGALMADITAQTSPEGQLAQLIVATLNLELLATAIDPEAPLYGEGLGLDSIDMLEIALVVSQQYGVKLRADDENNQQIFSSLRSLSAFIQRHRAP